MSQGIMGRRLKKARLGLKEVALSHRQAISWGLATKIQSNLRVALLFEHSTGAHYVHYQDKYMLAV